MKPLLPVLVLITVVTLSRVYLSGELELAEDEAYYWMWGSASPRDTSTTHPSSPG